MRRAVITDPVAAEIEPAIDAVTLALQPLVDFIAFAIETRVDAVAPVIESCGQVIASLGNSGRSTGPHLHYVVEVKGKAVNPLDYIFD